LLRNASQTFNPLININLINPNFFIVHFAASHNDHIFALTNGIIRFREIRELGELFPLTLDRIPGFDVRSIVASNAIRAANGDKNVETGRDFARFETDTVSSDAFLDDEKFLGFH
jgi:hypothetical protein